MNSPNEQSLCVIRFLKALRRPQMTTHKLSEKEQRCIFETRQIADHTESPVHLGNPLKCSFKNQRHKIAL